MARATTPSVLRWQDQVELFDEMVLSWLSFGQQTLDTTHYKTVLNHPVFSDNKIPVAVNSWEEKGCTRKFVQTVIKGQYQNAFPPPPPQTRKILTAKPCHISKKPKSRMASLTQFTSKVDKDWVPDESDLSDYEPENEPEPDEPPSVETWELKNPGHKYGDSQWLAEDLNSALKLTAKPTAKDMRVPFLQKASAYRNRQRHKRPSVSPVKAHRDWLTGKVNISPIRSTAGLSPKLSSSTPPGKPHKLSTARRLYMERLKKNKREKQLIKSPKKAKKHVMKQSATEQTPTGDPYTTERSDKSIDDTTFTTPKSVLPSPQSDICTPETFLTPPLPQLGLITPTPSSADSTPVPPAQPDLMSPTSCFDKPSEFLSAQQATSLQSSQQSSQQSSFCSERRDTDDDLPNLSDTDDPVSKHANKCPWSHSTALSTTVITEGAAYCVKCKAVKLEPMPPPVTPITPQTPCTEQKPATSLSVSGNGGIDTGNVEVNRRRQKKTEVGRKTINTNRREKITPKRSVSDGQKENTHMVAPKLERNVVLKTPKSEYHTPRSPLRHSNTKAVLSLDGKYIDLTMLPAKTCKVQKRITDFFKR